MNDTEPQTASGKVLIHFAMSLDGRSLFDDDAVPIELDLFRQPSFKQGVTMGCNAIRDVKETSSC